MKIGHYFEVPHAALDGDAAGVMVRSSSPRNGGPSGGRATCGIAGGKDAIRAVSDAGDLYTFCTMTWADMAETLICIAAR
jgi:hypothetical protein